MVDLLISKQRLELQRARKRLYVGALNTGYGKC